MNDPHTPPLVPGGIPPYIICVDLRDQVACVVGGGRVAAHKVEALLECGAIVHVIAESLCDALAARRDEPALAGRLIWHEGPYRGQMPRSRIVIACTDDRQVNRRVRDDCRAAGTLCNVVDDPELCDFIVPAVRQRGRVRIAVSTGGASPTMAGALADQALKSVDPAAADLADLLAAVRLEVQKQIGDTARRKAFFGELCGAESLRVLKESGTDGWRQWFQRRLAEYR